MALQILSPPVVNVGDTIADRPVSPANMSLFWNRASNGISFYDGSAWNSGGPIGSFNVVDYGANGSGNPADATANTTAIQAAINAIPSSGGELYFPSGHYYVNGELILKSNVRVQGTQTNAVLIEQTIDNNRVFVATDVLHVTIQNLQIKGTGLGTGIGIHFVRSARTSNYLALRDLEITNFGSDGIRWDEVIVSTIQNVVVNTVGGHGFNVLSTVSVSTSLTFISTYALACNQAGYNLNACTYVGLHGCASDSNGIGYLITGSSGVTLNACGAESCRNVNGTYNAIGFKISASTDVTLNSCYQVLNQNISYWITSNSSRVLLNVCREVSQGGGAVNAIQVDAGCSRVSILHKDFLSPLSLSAKTTNFPASEVVAIKTANQFVTNSTALVNDNTLFVTVDANSVYDVELFLVYNASTTGNIQCAFNGPAGATLSWTIDGVVLAAGATSGSILRADAAIGDAGAQAITGSGSLMMAKIKGTLTVAATAGTLQFRWAQNTADNVVSTSVRTDSFLRIRQIG